MDLPPDTDTYIKESIESSLGLPVSSSTLRLKLISSEDSRRRLQDQIFILEERLRQSKAEATMSAQGMRRCIEEKEKVEAVYSAHCAKLEQECRLYEQDLEKIMESCDELARENEVLRSQIQEGATVNQLAAEVEQLQKEREHLRINLQKAEQEVTVLFEENKLLDGENKMLLKQMNREKSVSKFSDSASSKVKVLLEENRLLDGENKMLLKQLTIENSGSKFYKENSGSKYSDSASSKGKRKSRREGTPTCTIDCDGKERRPRREVTPARPMDLDGKEFSRQPLSPLPLHLPDFRANKK